VLSREEQEREEFFMRNPSLEPGVYNENFEVYPGKKTQEYRAKDLFKNPNLVQYAGGGRPPPGTTVRTIDRQQPTTTTNPAAGAPSSIPQAPAASLSQTPLYKAYFNQRTVSVITNPVRAATSAAIPTPAKKAAGGFLIGASDMAVSGAKGSYKILSTRPAAAVAMDVTRDITDTRSGQPVALRARRAIVPRIEAAAALGADRDVQTAGALVLAPVALETPLLGTVIKLSMPVFAGKSISDTIKNPTPFNVGRATTDVALSVLAINSLRSKPYAPPPPDGRVDIFSVGKQGYTVEGQTLRPLKSTPTARVTTYDAQGSSVKIVETKQGLFTTTTKPGTTITTAQRPTETTNIYKNKFFSIDRVKNPPGEQTQVTTSQNNFIRIKTTKTTPAAKPERLPPPTTTQPTKPFYTAKNIDTSIVTQRSASGEVATYTGEINGKPYIGAVLSGTQAESVSMPGRLTEGKLARQAAFTVTDTPTDVAIKQDSITFNTQPTESVLAGRTKVRLDVSKGETPKNEFVATRNEFVAPQEAVYIEGIGDTKFSQSIPLGETNLFSGEVRKPFIESIVQRRNYQTGTIDFSPKQKTRGTKVDYSAIIKREEEYKRREMIKQILSDDELRKIAGLPNKQSAKIQPPNNKKIQPTPINNKNDVGGGGVVTEQVTITKPQATLEVSRLDNVQQPTNQPVVSFSDTTNIKPVVAISPNKNTIFNTDITPDTAQEQNAASTTVTIQKPVNLSIPKIRTGTESKIEPKIDQSMRSRTANATATKTEQLVEQVQVQELQTEQLIDRPSRMGFSSTQLTTNIRLGEEITPIIVAPLGTDAPRVNKNTFDVFVKQGGVFRRVNAKGLQLDAAFDSGQRVVRDTAAASFKVTRSGDTRPVQNEGFINNKIFGRSKKDAGVFVQKREYRISSGGEKSEITFKGLQSSRQKRGLRL
jgi:hypothetical protein